MARSEDNIAMQRLSVESSMTVDLSHLIKNVVANAVRFSAAYITDEDAAKTKLKIPLVIGMEAGLDAPCCLFAHTNEPEDIFLFGRRRSDKPLQSHSAKLVRLYDSISAEASQIGKALTRKYRFSLGTDSVHSADSFADDLVAEASRTAPTLVKHFARAFQIVDDIGFVSADAESGETWFSDGAGASSISSKVDPYLGTPIHISCCEDISTIHGLFQNSERRRRFDAACRLRGICPALLLDLALPANVSPLFCPTQVLWLLTRETFSVWWEETVAHERHARYTLNELLEARSSQAATAVVAASQGIRVVFIISTGSRDILPSIVPGRQKWGSGMALDGRNATVKPPELPRRREPSVGSEPFRDRDTNEATIQPGIYRLLKGDAKCRRTMERMAA